MKLDSINSDFRIILDAKARGDWAAVNESSLSRAYQHVKNGKFGILTNHRAGRSPAENRTGFYQLKDALRSHGLGGIVLQGHWLECQDPNIPYDQCPKDLLRDVAEPSLFVPNIGYDLIISLGKKYDQDAVVYCGPESGGKVTLIFKDGGILPIGDFQPNKIAQAYSKLPGKDGKTFVFEYVVQGHVEGLIAEKTRKI